MGKLASSAIALLSLTLGLLPLDLGRAAAASAPAPPAPGTFAHDARRIRIGASQKRVRKLLGEPHERDATTWTYRDPPHRPDGPYHWYTFTFARGHVSKIDDGGVACVYREYRERSAPPARAPAPPPALARRHSP